MGYTFTFCNRIEHTDLDLDRHRGASRPAYNSATLRPVFVYITDCSDGCLATKRTIAAFLSHPPSRTMRLGELCIPAERRNDFRIEFFFRTLESFLSSRKTRYCFVFLLYVGDDFKRFERFCFRYSNACTEQLRSKYRLFSSVHVLWANLYAP